jgi:hypothetical protein
VGQPAPDEQPMNVDLDPMPPPPAVYVSGEVGTTDSIDVAVAINGRIGGWAETQPTDVEGVQRFWVLVPPSFLEPDGNDVEVYALP